MSLSDLASLGSFVSGIAVLVSLVLLYIQLRQINEQAQLASKHMRAQLWQGASTRGAEVMLTMATADMCAAYLEGNGQVATPEAIRARQFMLQVFATYDISVADMFQQAQDGLSTDQRLKHIRAQVISILKLEPGTRRMLSERLASLTVRTDPYQDFLREMVAEAGE